MVIKTENFQKYSRLILVPYDKASRLRSHIYLDFKNKKAIITGNEMNCAFTFDHDDSEMDSFYVSIPEFLALCNAYESLTITKHFNSKKELVFNLSYGDEVFEISTFTEEEPDISANDINDPDTVSLSLNNQDIVRIKNAINFMGQKEEDFLTGLKISSHIYSADGSRLYEANMSFQTENSYSIDKELSQVITSIPDDKLTLSVTPSGNVVVKGNNIYCVSSLMKDLALKEDFDDPDFIKRYDHDSFIIVSKSGLLQILDFFAPFVNNDKNERLILNVEDNKLAIQAKGVNIGTRYLDILDSNLTEIIANDIWVSRNMVYDSVTIIEDENICIQMGDSDASAYNVSGENNKDVHVTNVLLV